MTIARMGRRVPRCWIPLAWIVAVLGGAPEARPLDPVQLAWRDDPRPSADVPAGVEPSTERWSSRRSLRRAARRGLPGDTPRAGAAATTPEPAAAPRPAPIAVETTLDSPFRPAEQASGRLTHRDQPYGTEGHVRQRFDICLPAACAGAGLPLVVWIHGDDWASGTKADCPVLWLVDHGYAVASLGYRTTADATFPAQLDDCRTGLATLLRDAELWGIDRHRVCVAGRGAGGHLAALVGFTPAVPAVAADRPAVHDAAPDIAAVCAVAAPAHLTSLGAEHDRGASAASRLVGGPLPEFRELALAASPLMHVSADDPPTLVVHGDRDPLVPVAQAQRLGAALEAAGVDTTVVILPAGHEIPLAEDAPAGRELRGFLGRVLGPGTPSEPSTPGLDAAAP